jgi:hypothetical protein
MLRKSLSFAALGVLTAVVAATTTPISGKIGELFSSSKVAEVSTPQAESTAVQTVAKQLTAADYENLNAEAQRCLVGKNLRQEPQELSELVALTDDEAQLGEALPEADAAIMAKARAAKKSHKVSTKAATIKTGAIIEIDHGSSGSNYGIHAGLSAVNAEDLSEGYQITNFYNLGDTIGLKLSIDAEAGTVSIPKQVVYNHATYGDVSFQGLVLVSGKYYLSTDPVAGTIDENGNISIDPWVLIVTGEGTYQNRTFIIATSSDYKVPNATVSATNAATLAEVSLDCYVDQTSSNSVSLYGFLPVGTAEMSARISSSKVMTMPYQYAYYNSYYGQFDVYDTTWTYDESSSAWKYKINTTGQMVFSTTADNQLSLGGYVIAATASPTQYIGYAMRDIVVTLSPSAITWPTAASITFDGEGTADSPYLIKTADDLTLLSQLVSEGNSFAGAYFALANDLDLSGLSNYTPVGDDVTKFEGTFDGQNHTISNFTIDGKAFLYTGIFGYTGEKALIKDIIVKRFVGSSDGLYLGTFVGYNDGKIENCQVDTAVLDSDGSCVGGIAGISDGDITGCSVVSSQITGSGSAAGIVGQAYCNITDCYVKAIITTDGYVSAAYDCAGIAGVMLNGSVKNCWSTGMLNEKYGRSSTGGLVGRAILADIENSFTSMIISTCRTYTDSNGGGDNYSGGLVGYLNESTMTNCYSSSTIVKTGTSDFCGGVVGYLAVSYMTSSGQSGYTMKGNSTVTNCYFSGYINSSSTTAKKGMFGSTFYLSSWTGEDPDVLCFKNCYYDKQINTFGEDEYGRTTSFFTNGLPEGFDSSVWEAKEGYYPVLKTVGAGTQAQALSSAPLLLKEGQTAKKVKVGFSVTPADDITWSIYGASDGETSSLKMEGNDVTVKNIYANEQVQAVSADGYSMKLYGLAIVPKLFDGEGTEESPYLIKSVADLEQLHEAVATAYQSHEGDYFAMTNDIDCSADDSTFAGVGHASSRLFAGTFDGRGYSIKNLKIDNIARKDDGTIDSTNCTYYGGLFTGLTETGTVKNVNIDSSCSFSFYGYSAPVVAVNNGRVENCRNYADVTAIVAYAGGVVGFNNAGTITGCYNAGRISAGSSNVGGITSNNSDGGVIELCQNDGDVIGESNDASNAKTTTNTIGGIACYNYGTVNLCVNNGHISGNNTIGGIVARQAGGTVTGCLNNGLVTTDVTVDTRGAIIGYLQTAGTIANNYYDSSVSINGACNNSGINGTTACATAELVAGVCPDELKALGADQVYDFTANAYPVLKQFVDEEATKALRTTYAAFAVGQVRNNITSDVTLVSSDDVKWELIHNEAFKIDGKKLTVTVPTDSKVATDTLTATIGSRTKLYGLTTVPVIFKGEGTEQSPFLIETPADWNKLADFVESSSWEYNDQYFKVANDLDFAGDSIRVIAHDGVNFNGVLDGAGHTVKGYVYANPNTVKTKLAGPNAYLGKVIGLFGTIGSFGVVKNLTIDGSFIAVTQLGALVGSCYGKVENVTHKGNISNTSGTCVSGIAYRVYTGGSLTDCVNEGQVTALTNQATGICYETQKGTTLTRCYNRGTVTSTKTMPCGIAYKVAGGLIDCGNEKELTGTGTIVALVNTMDSTAYAVNCYNTANLGSSSVSNVSGLFYSFSTRAAVAGVIPGGGYVKDCYNTGNITAKDHAYGFAYQPKNGWTFTNVYNTGDITSSGLACGLCNSATGSTGYIITFDHCYNTGVITGNKAAVAGLCSDASNYSKFSYCYNTGDVTNKLANCLCTGGLVAKLNGLMEYCFNAGDVRSQGYAVGGLAGYISYGKEDYTGRIYNSFNVGNVTSYYTGTSTNGNAGGLVGYMATSNANYHDEIANSYNSGTVKAVQRAGGLVGGMFNPYHVVYNCYNSGRVITTAQTDGDETVYRQAGCVFANYDGYNISDDETVAMQRYVTNCYYDKTVFPGEQLYKTPAVGLTTTEFADLSISDSFQAPTVGYYPNLKGFEDSAVDAAATSSITILVADEDTENHDLIAKPVTLIAPEGTTWATYSRNSDDSLVPTSSMMTIEGTTATPIASGDVVLLAFYKGNLYREFNLTLDPNFSGVDQVAAGKTVAKVTYIDIQGRVVVNPSAGRVYIVRTDYTDGTSSVNKVVAK